jgi:threonine/homoserine/homoserine lactone efflux protein
VGLNTLVDVMAVLGAQRLLQSGLGRSARARLVTRASGVTMVVLGAWLALSKRA